MAWKCLRHRETIWLEEGHTAEPEGSWKWGLGLKTLQPRDKGI